MARRLRRCQLRARPNPMINRSQQQAILRSSTFRHAATVAGLVVLSGTALVALLLLFTVILERHQGDLVREDVAALLAIHDRSGVAALAGEITRRARAAGPGSLGLLSPDPIYALAPPTGETVIAGNIPQWPIAMEAISRDEVAFSIVRPEIDPQASNAVRAIVAVLPGGSRLLVGRDVDNLHLIERTLEAAPVWLLVCGLLSGLLAGWVASHRILGRIDEMSETAGRIMRGDLAHRMPTSGRGDEFDRLAGTLNRMLSAIESLMRTVRSVTDDIAHDLRTPLTRVRNQLERAQASGDVATMRDAVEECAVEVDRMLSTFDAMLTIASTESGTLASQMERVSLAELAHDVEDLYRPMAEDRGQSLHVMVAGDPNVQGNRQLLFQALTNLVENAIKYTPQGGHIAVAARGSADEPATLVVADDGPGIPPEDRERAVQRFVRLDASRTQPGNGLGLALVAAVARMHGAQLVLDDNRPGLAVRLLFDAAAPAEASPPP